MFAFMDAGQFESDEADAVREEMVDPWYALSAEEQKRMDGLVMDLNNIRRQDRNIEGQPNWRDVATSPRLRDISDPDKTLDAFRELQEVMPAWFVSFARGRIWMTWGIYEVAVQFFRDAYNLNNSDQMMLGMYLQVLRQVNPQDAKAFSDRILATPENYYGSVLTIAVDAQRASITERGGEAVEKYRRLLPVLKVARAKLIAGEPCPPQMYQMNLALSAELFSLVGEKERAFDEITEAIKLESGTQAVADLFAFRGKLTYPNPQGVDDLIKAINLNVSTSWPYLWVAKFLLEQHDFEHCLQVCEIGVRRVRDEEAKSKLLDLSAISMAGLRYAKDEVRQRFILAIETFPPNEEARENLQRYLAGMKQVEAQQKQAEAQHETLSQPPFSWRIRDDYFESVEQRETQNSRQERKLAQLEMSALN